MSVNIERTVYGAINFGCGALAGLTLVYPTVWPVAFISMVPLFFAIIGRNCTQRQAFMFGYVWGAGLIGVSLSFVFGMLPLDWLGVSAPLVGGVVVTALWVFLLGVLAIPVGVFGTLLWHMRHVHKLILVAICPVAWVLLELIRAIIFSILALGPGTSIGPHFTFAFLGYVFAGAHGLLFLAPIGGPLFLSWLVVFVNASLFFVLQLLFVKRWWAGITACLVFIVGLIVLNAVLPARVHISVGAGTVEVGGVSVGLIHTNEEASFELSPDTALLARTRLEESIIASLSETPDAKVIILPEDSRFEQVISNPNTSMDHATLETLAKRQALLIGSGRVDDGQNAHGVLYVYDFAIGAPIQFSAKSYLVPFGEYVPFVISMFGKIFGFEKPIQNLVDARASYIPSKWNPEERVVDWNGVSYGILSCSELFTPYFMRDVAHAGADVVVLMSSQSWVKSSSPILFNQMLGMAVVGSAWVGKPYLQATNGAPNIFIGINH